MKWFILILFCFQAHGAFWTSLERNSATTNKDPIVAGPDISGQIPMTAMVPNNSEKQDWMVIGIDTNGNKKLMFTDGLGIRNLYLEQITNWSAFYIGYLTALGGINAALNPPCIIADTILSNTTARINIANYTTVPVIPAGYIFTGWQLHATGLGQLTAGPLANAANLRVGFDLNNAIIASNEIPKALFAGTSSRIIYELFLTARGVTNNIASVAVDGYITVYDPAAAKPNLVPMTVPSRVVAITNTGPLTNIGWVQWAELPQEGDNVIVTQGHSR